MRATRRKDSAGKFAEVLLFSQSKWVVYLNIENKKYFVILFTINKI
jgi:hypothetical protein